MRATGVLFPASSLDPFMNRKDKYPQGWSKQGQQGRKTHWKKVAQGPLMFPSMMSGPGGKMEVSLTGHG